MTKQYELLLGDCLEKLKTLPDNSVDAIVTDPPYGLGKEPDALKMLTDWMETGHHEVKGRGFMGKTWDAFVPQPAQWRECLRVLKPGGYLLAFAGTRTQDLMCLGLRLAGFEIRDMVAWVYGSGFPKSLDVSKALDKMAGAEREVIGTRTSAFGDAETSDTGDGRNLWCKPSTKEVPLTGAPATDAAKQWNGWGTALKPALEPITLARKPLEGTVAANVLKWHTGGLNIDGCRVGDGEDRTSGGLDGKKQNATIAMGGSWSGERFSRPIGARFPANLIHDGSDEVVALFPNTKSGTISPHHQRHTKGGNGNTHGDMAGVLGESYGDSGSAARFFYQPKTSKADRNEGCDSLPDKEWRDENTANPNRENRPFNPSKNDHNTVKPTDLMRYLCRLVTPPGGTILDPFMGSGSTGKAAAAEGFRFIGIELEEPSFKIATARIEHAYFGDI